MAVEFIVMNPPHQLSKIVPLLKIQLPIGEVELGANPLPPLLKTVPLRQIRLRVGVELSAMTPHHPLFPIVRSLEI